MNVVHIINEALSSKRTRFAFELLPPLKGDGMQITQTGWIDGDSHYYMNTEELLKMTLEFGNGGRIDPAEQVFHGGEKPVE